jgi:hypothetical protein
VQTTQNASGDWVSNGIVQNISPDSLKQVLAILHLYDCSGHIVGYAEGFTVPYNLSSTQMAIFKPQAKSNKYDRHSKINFANATGDNIISSGSNSTISGYANSITDAADSGSRCMQE